MSDLFGFDDLMGMVGNYDQRKISRYDDEKSKLSVSTCSVTDSDYPFETAIAHPFYNEGGWIVVENYGSKEEASLGHSKWVKAMTANELPSSIEDISGAKLRKWMPEKMEFKKKTVVKS